MKLTLLTDNKVDEILLECCRLIDIKVNSLPVPKKSTIAFSPSDTTITDRTSSSEVRTAVETKEVTKLSDQDKEMLDKMSYFDLSLEFRREKLIVNKNR